MARPSYPSDHRRWFRLTTDLIRKVVDDSELATIVRLIAEMNERRCERTDGKIVLHPGSRMVISNRRQQGSADRLLAHTLAALDSDVSRKDDGTWVVHVTKYLKYQGFTPSELRRNSDETTATTPTPTTTKEKSTKKESPARLPARSHTPTIFTTTEEALDNTEVRALIEARDPLPWTGQEQEHREWWWELLEGFRTGRSTKSKTLPIQLLREFFVAPQVKKASYDAFCGAMRKYLRDGHPAEGKGWQYAVGILRGWTEPKPNGSMNSRTIDPSDEQSYDPIGSRVRSETKRLLAEQAAYEAQVKNETPEQREEVARMLQDLKSKLGVG